MCFTLGCGHHNGTGLIRYLRPKFLYSTEGDKLISAFYAVIGPALNPFIYSLGNKEVLMNILIF